MIAKLLHIKGSIVRILRCLFLQAAVLCFGAHVQAQPVLSEVVIAQRENTKLVDITYSLAGDAQSTYTVNFEATRDAGQTYQAISAVTGAVGSGITAGTNKTAVWDAGAEFPGLLFPGVRVRASAVGSGTGTINGVVKDGLSGVPLPGVTLQFFSGASAVGSTVTGASGNYSLTVPGGSLRASVSLAGYVSTSLSVTAIVAQVVEADVVLFAPSRTGNGTIRGTAVNSFNAAGVAGATIKLRSGVSTNSGTILETVVADGAGRYTFLVPGGSYTIEGAADGFSTGFSNVVAVGGQTISNQNVGLTPNLQADQIRVVLNWGSVPSDLDSHLAGPLANTGTFHAYFSNSAPTGSNVTLDTDDTSSFGPETITISTLRPGNYRYWVHDFTNRSNSNSSILSQQSAARVTIYRGTGSGTATVAVFNVPTGKVGNAWVVFDLDGITGAITPQNEILTVASESTIP